MLMASSMTLSFEHLMSNWGGCVSAPCAVKDIVIPPTVEDSGMTYSVTSIGTGAFRLNNLN